MKKNCQYCNKEFTKTPNESRKYWIAKKYCSKKCGATNRFFSEESKRKTSESLKKFYKQNPNARVGYKPPSSKGYHWKKTPEQLKNKMGLKNPAWKGGITPINSKIRNSQEYAEWRKKVFERDNYICQKCWVKGVYLHADHIKPFSTFPKLRFVLQNGRTLCVPCHRLTPTYGGRVIKNKNI